MEQRYNVVIPYEEPTYGAKTYNASIEVSAESERRARELALSEFRKLEELSGVRWPREVSDKKIIVKSLSGSVARRFPLELHVEIWDDVAVVQVHGVVDEESYHALGDKLGVLVEEGYLRILIDCSEIEYISSAGIGSITAAADRATVKLSCVPDKVRRMLVMVGLDKTMGLFDTNEAALRSF